MKCFFLSHIPHFGQDNIKKLDQKPHQIKMTVLLRNKIITGYYELQSASVGIE